MEDIGDQARAFQGLLIDWYRADGRDLPWRRTRDPYRILTSEVMLQQTQAARVAEPYTAFVAAYPTVRALAEARAAEVLTVWRGLGYNRRAVNLHQAAQLIVTRHSGRVPDDFDALRALPGVGEYTARAVLTFAFGREAGPVDTNIARVLMRAISGQRLERRALQRLADQLASSGHGPEWSHALMDLGARYCTASRPRCEACPLTPACAWAGRHDEKGDDPAAAPARLAPRERFTGSARFHRGRLVDALRDGPVPRAELAAAADLLSDPRRAASIAEALVDDGLAEWSGPCLQLPGQPFAAV